MRDQGIWSLNLGRWGNVRVRLHMFFLLFAAFSLFLGWQHSGDGSFQLAAISLGILLASVVLHEVGHLQVARFFGGSLDEMVLTPLGGLAAMRPPRNPRHEVLAHLAGPLVNLLLAVICFVVLLFFAPSGEAGAPWSLFNPLQPDGVQGSLDQLGWDALRLGVWINWMLALINLLPAFPFDGGRALRAGLSLMWQRAGRQYAARVVSRVAMFGAVALLVAAACLAIQRDAHPLGERVVPLWFGLALLGIFLLFSARLEEERPDFGEEDDDRLFDYDFSAGYTSLERSAEAAVEEPDPGPFSVWLEERKAARQRRQREREQEDEQRVDEILARLHAEGMQSLSVDDKALLERVSARYRNREGHGA